MKKQFLLLAVSLLGISLLIISMSQSYREWTSLKARNHSLEESIEKQKRTLTKLTNNIHLATKIATNPTKAYPIHAKQEHEALLRGYIKRGDHIIELVLPPLSGKTPSSIEKSQNAPKNWRVLIVITYFFFIIITLLLFYKRQKSQQKS